ncbi:unnamed protein product [Tuwongella immobilis]|uniref:Uncharacterized protein n=1 Tax=Tuwongella immobilis TaxID=692036 RepID=A0A6C2YI52_9BACT|nr:unnamed protein product [Tuwongella immobilis]VTR96762.1 unnamed protein product [Tuwongella immobilis]
MIGTNDPTMLTRLVRNALPTMRPSAIRICEREIRRVE